MEYFEKIDTLTKSGITPSPASYSTLTLHSHTQLEQVPPHGLLELDRPGLRQSSRRQFPTSGKLIGVEDGG